MFFFSAVCRCGVGHKLVRARRARSVAYLGKGLVPRQAVCLDWVVYGNVLCFSFSNAVGNANTYGLPCEILFIAHCSDAFIW